MTTSRKIMIGVFLVAVCFASARIVLLEANEPTADEVPTEKKTDTDSPIEIDQDPLYQAILKQLREGRTSLSTEVVEVRSADEGAGREQTSAQWQAIELMLRAARILEREEKRASTRGQTKQSVILQSTIQQLRSNVIDIIRAMSE